MPVLKQYDSDFGTIRIMRSARDGGMAYFQNGCFHSQANRDGISVCAYIHVLHEIIRQSHVRNVLIIGCAGGTLATMLRHLNCHVTVVDINPLAFPIAREHFRLPGDVRCICRDGLAYLRTTKQRYDAVVVDVFGSDNAVPPVFTTAHFFRHVTARLSSPGVMIMNVITVGDEDMRADHVALNAEATGMEITVFDWPGHQDRNSLIVGNMTRRVHIPSGKEPHWIKDDLEGITRRRPRHVRVW